MKRRHGIRAIAAILLLVAGCMPSRSQLFVVREIRVATLEQLNDAMDRKQLTPRQIIRVGELARLSDLAIRAASLAILTGDAGTLRKQFGEAKGFIDELAEILLGVEADSKAIRGAR